MNIKTLDGVDRELSASEFDHLSLKVNNAT